METLYRSPLRVYVILCVLGLLGIWSGLQLPISLFPNSSQSTVSVNVGYGDLTAQEFLSNYGSQLEYQLKGVQVDGSTAEKITAEYRNRNLRIRLVFPWGVNGDRAEREAKSTALSLASGWPEEIRRTLWVNSWNENGGFFAVSFYSNEMALTQLYDFMKPLLEPHFADIPDASEIYLHNPKQEYVRVELDPNVMASLRILPSDVERAIYGQKNSYSGGALSLGENQLPIEVLRGIGSVKDLELTPVTTPFGKRVLLRDFARVSLETQTKWSRSFKTSGIQSLILFVSPKPGANIRQMSLDTENMLKNISKDLPTHVQSKILVNPAQFIDSSIGHVVKEVLLAAALAVFILYLFMGNLQNVVTAAIEIPLSLIMALILMKIFGMNLNLISLGGLALSAGMNVDASVVVLENIFRHMGSIKHPLSFSERLRFLTIAVNEVRVPILVSTLTSLIVFAPLITLGGMANAILSDLAKAVIFSHGLSALVALVLVPTVRLHIMNRRPNVPLPHNDVFPLKSLHKYLEKWYLRVLEFLLSSKKALKLTFGSIPIVLAILFFVVLPRLPRELIGKPETDWIYFAMTANSYSEPYQMESFADQTEAEILKKHNSDISYTFTQLQGAKYGQILVRLKTAKKMDQIKSELETEFPNTPEVSFVVDTWNPSEFSLPDYPDLEYEIKGGTSKDRAQIALNLKELLQEDQTFTRIQTRPESEKDFQVQVSPHWEVLQELNRSGVASLSNLDLAQYLRIATQGRSLGYFNLGSQVYSVDLEFKKNQIKGEEDLRALPIPVSGKILPLSALVNVQRTESETQIHRVNQSEVTLLQARLSEKDKPKIKQLVKSADDKISDFLKKNLIETSLSVNASDPKRDQNNAIRELSLTIALSLLLVLLVLFLEFQEISATISVFAAIPFGLIGVLISLFIFQSTLSLNSALGTLLLNGISVANSIILVDLMKRLMKSGTPPKEAALIAAKARLRPILMTSLTTILGMLPVALGLGQGGRILQPLGIAVAGGLWVSMLLTLVLVPALYSQFHSSFALLSPRTHPKEPEKSSKGLLGNLISIAFLASFSIHGAHGSTFVEAFQKIRAVHPSLLKMHNNLKSVEYSNFQNKMEWTPSLQAEFSQSHTNAQTVGVSASWNLFRFGADLASRRKSQALLEKAQREMEITGFEVDALVSDLLFSLLAARESHVNLTASLKRKENLVNIAEKRYRRGELPLQEVEKTKLDHDALVISWNDSQTELDRLQTQIQTLAPVKLDNINWPPPAPFLFDSEPHWVPTQNLSDTAALMAQVRILEESVLIAQRSQLPSLNLSTSWQTGSTTSWSPGEWQTYLTLSVPIWDQAAKYANYKQTYLELENLRIEKDFRVRSLEQERRILALSLKRKQENFNRAAQGRATAKRIYSETLRRFELGHASVNDVYLDESRYFSSENLVQNTQRQLHQSFVQSCHQMNHTLLECWISN